MREVIKNQLRKIRNVSYMNDEENHIIHFYKQQSFINEFKIDGFYDIEVDEDTLHNTKSVLYINYNNSSLPPDKYLTIGVEKIVGKFIKVTAITADKKMWQGYLAADKIKKIKEIEG